MEIVRDTLGDRLVSREPDEGGGLDLSEDDEYLQFVGLANLAQLCHQIPRADWLDVIQEHFDSALQPEPFPCTFEEAQPMLRVRLVTDYPGTASPETRFLLARPVADGLYSTLTVATSGNGATFPTPDLIAPWNLDVGLLFDTGLANVRRLKQPQVKVARGAAPLRFLLGDDIYISSRLLFLRDFLDEPAPHGAIAVIPTRDWVAFQPIVDTSIEDSVFGAVTFARQTYDEGPISLSPELYWWRDESISLLPTVADGRGWRIAPPPEFVDVLNSLPSPA